MNWKNLKDNACPKCKCPLEEDGDSHRCSSLDCDFSCPHEKFESIVNSLYRPRARAIEPEENLKALNDL